MHLFNLLVSFICSVFVLIASASFASAQDNVEGFEVSNEYNHQITLGVGYGFTMRLMPIIDFGVEYLYQANESWRTGVAEKIHIDKNWVHNSDVDVLSKTLWMNEFVVYHSDKFEFTPRAGFGFAFNKWKEDDDEAPKTYSCYMFAISLGLGVGWNLTEHLTLGVDLEYMFGVGSSKSESSDEKLYTLHALDLMLKLGYRF